jgi:hypothetical protein
VPVSRLSINVCVVCSTSRSLTVARARFPQTPEPDPILAQLEALGVIEAPVVSLVVPAMKLRAEGRLARFLPQWRIRR